jgi:hypothetical protein
MRPSLLFRVLGQDGPEIYIGGVKWCGSEVYIAAAVAVAMSVCGPDDDETLLVGVKAICATGVAVLLPAMMS